MAEKIESKEEAGAAKVAEEATGEEEKDSPRTDEFGRTMYPATCSECNQATEVPFKPTEGRPIYCRDCYSKKRKFGGRNNYRR